MNDRATISVIIPVYNGATFLGDAIQSVLSQNYEPLEIIVVNDGSTDDTAGVATSFGSTVRYHHQENAGAAAARNQGLSMATGDFIAFLDADDLYVPGKLAGQMRRFEKTPDCEIVIGGQQYEALDGSNDAISLPNRAEARGEHLSLQLGCSLFRRDVFAKVGGFNVSLRHCDDWDWFLRARELGVRIIIHRDVVLRQRLHASNLTRQQEEGAKYQRLVFKLSLDRRRALGARAVSLPPLASFLEDAARETSGAT
jgi:glycosyltransferase involved in cell wall biosynthesis